MSAVRVLASATGSAAAQLVTVGFTIWPLTNSMNGTEGGGEAEGEGDGEAPHLPRHRNEYTTSTHKCCRAVYGAR
jgi:hypothetical protein